MSDGAWKQLLGCEVSDVMDFELYWEQLERRLLFARISMLFYWSAKVGRLVILRVQVCEEGCWSTCEI